MRNTYLFLFILLASCTFPKYDNNEMLLLSSIITETEFIVEQCPEIYSEDLLFDSKQLMYYTKYSSKDEIYTATTELYNLIAELNEKTIMSETYCRFKIQNILDVSNRIAISIGREEK